MKTILQTIILMISVVTFSQQKLIGEYCSIPIGESDVTCINFKKYNQFDYVVSGCLGTSAFGSGKYELKNDSLNLIFDKTEQHSKSKIEIVENERQSGKEAILKFNIVDENGFELPANVIRTSDRKHFFYDKPNRTFIVKKNSPKAKYKIEFIGYESLEMIIEHTIDKEINITLFPAQAKIISDKELSIRWHKINNNEFEIGSNSWDRFKKVNK